MPRFHDSVSGEPLAAETPRIAIHDAPAPAGSPAPALATPAGGAHAHATGSPAWNGRSPGRLGTNAWSLRWSSRLRPGLRAEHLLEVQDRVLALGPEAWELFDLADGRSLAGGRRGQGDAILDPTAGCLYVVDAEDTLQAYALADGERRFAAPLFGGAGFRRTFLAAHAGRLLVVSVDARVTPHMDVSPELSLIEVSTLGDPPEADEFGLLSSSRTLRGLVQEATLLLAAADAERVVFATEDAVYLADWDLQVSAVLEGSFVPEALSLGDAGRVHLVVRGKGARALWVLTPAGERVLEHPLPPDWRPTQPPIAGFDSSAFLVGPGRVQAIAPDGALAWEHTSAEGVAGASVTADGRLLVGLGKELVAFDAGGRPQALHTLSGGARGAPLLTEKRELLVAGGGRVSCLEPPSD